MSISQELNEITQTLNNAQYTHRLVVEKDQEGCFHPKLRCSISNFFPSYIRNNFYSKELKENKETLEYFFRVFGKSRVFRIGDRYGVNFQKKYDNGEGVSRTDIEKLFVGSADLRIEDVNELFLRIKSPEVHEVLFLNKEQTSDLKKEFSSIKITSPVEDSFVNESKEKLERLIDLLIPFANVSDVFMGNLPNINPLAHGSGKTWDSKRQLVRALLELRHDARFHLLPSWSFRVANLIANREPPEGTIVAHQEGYLKVHRRVHGGGAFKLFLKTLTQQKEKFFSGVVYRGTRGHFRATSSLRSIWDDLQMNMGINGIRATFKETNSLLNDVKAGFIHKEDEPIWFLGLSLGGGHAQRDFCAQFKRIVEKESVRHMQLRTVNSISVDRVTAEYFAKLCKDYKGQLHILRISEAEDVIHHFGEAHIGAGCDPEKVHIDAISFEHVDHSNKNCGKRHWDKWPTPIETPQDRIKGFVKFLRTVVGVHIRETPSMPHCTYQVCNRHPGGKDRIEDILNPDQDPKRSLWEKRRQELSFGHQNSFVDFLKSLNF
ncbi:MAG: hypothetical protein CMO81_06385 [Waddliaceae bacterium]|nr:hypothetical protein [Waddliaceae bacterium]